MQVRGLLVAVVLLLLLGGGVYWSNKSKEAEEKAGPKDASPKLTNIAESEIRQVELKRKDGELTTLIRSDNGTWTIKTPAEYAADKESISSWMGTAAALVTDQLVEEKAGDVKAFGLDAPAFTMTITKKDGKSVKVLVGDEVPTGSGYYARLDGDPRVFTIAGYNKTSIDKKAADLRDRRLLTFDQDKLIRIELTAKQTTTEFAKNNANEWTIVKPQTYRADNWAVEELLRRLREAKLDPAQTEDDLKKAAATFATAAPVAVAKATDAAGTQTLEVRKGKDDKYLAKSSAVAGVHVLTGDIGEGLGKSTDDFRAKKVFDFGFSDPSKVDYKDGAKTLSLAKSGEKWQQGGKDMDTVSVQSLIDKLRDLSAEKFGDKGFATPVIEITIVSNEGKRTEKVAIAQDGKQYWARREGEPALYGLESRVIDELRQIAGGVKEPPPPSAPAKK